VAAGALRAGRAAAVPTSASGEERPVSSPAQPEPTQQQPAGSEPVPDRFAAERAALSGLDQRPLGEHAEVFAQVHGQLQAALAEIDGI
jgi:hypothetical protein